MITRKEYNDYETSSPSQYYRKCRENSVENKYYTDVRR